MTRVLGAGVLSTFLIVLLGSHFIGFLRGRSLGQNIREEGPEGHKTKAGTPTMGGLLILTMAAIAFLAFSRRTVEGTTVLLVTLACAAIGFVDDYAKVANKRSLGLSGRWKLLLLVPVAAVLAYVAHHQGVSTDLYIPLVDVHLGLGLAWYALVYLVLAGATNAVNLTDGLDGLAAGTSAIAFLAYTAIGVIAYRTQVGKCATHEHTDFLRCGSLSRIDIAIFAGAVLGCCVGFLWYNSFPAQVFMGDTGSFGLGAAFASIAVFTKTEFLAIGIGGVFVIEALSVIAQVVSFKRFGRRVLLMAPIHHHFELKGWSEVTVIIRFWILAALFAGSAFVLFYLRSDQYR